MMTFKEKKRAFANEYGKLKAQKYNETQTRADFYADLAYQNLSIEDMQLRIKKLHKHLNNHQQ